MVLALSVSVKSTASSLFLSLATVLVTVIFTGFVTSGRITRQGSSVSPGKLGKECGPGASFEEAFLDSTISEFPLVSVSFLDVDLRRFFPLFVFSDDFLNCGSAKSGFAGSFVDFLAEGNGTESTNCDSVESFLDDSFSECLREDDFAEFFLDGDFADSLPDDFSQSLGGDFVEILLEDDFVESLLASDSTEYFLDDSFPESFDKDDFTESIPGNDFSECLLRGSNVSEFCPANDFAECLLWLHVSESFSADELAESFLAANFTERLFDANFTESLSGVA